MIVRFVFERAFIFVLIIELHVSFLIKIHLLEFRKLNVVYDLIKIFLLHIFHCQILRIELIFDLLLFYININLFLLKVFKLIFDKFNKVHLLISFFDYFASQFLGNFYVFHLVFTWLNYYFVILLRIFCNSIFLLKVIQHVFR